MTKVYEVQIDTEEKPTYAGTMADAKAAIKTAVENGAVYLPDVRVTECEVQSDKEGLIFALNRLPVMTRGRTWMGTPRGGLKEMV